MQLTRDFFSLDKMKDLRVRIENPFRIASLVHHRGSAVPQRVQGVVHRLYPPRVPSNIYRHGFTTRWYAEIRKRQTCRPSQNCSKRIGQLKLPKHKIDLSAMLFRVETNSPT